MLYVFSTNLANQACEAVKSGRFPNVIAYHQSLEDTKRLLLSSKTSSAAVSSSTLSSSSTLTSTSAKFSPAKLSTFRSSLNGPLNATFGCSDVTSSPRSSSVGVNETSNLELVNSQQTSANNKYANFTKSEIQQQQQQQQSCSKSEDHKPNMCNNNRTNSNDTPKTPTTVNPPMTIGPGRSSSVDNFSPQTADVGNMILTDLPPFCNAGGNPLEKMAKLTQDTLPLEPPLKQQKLGSPKEKSAKISDDQLTPAARQHRHEALQKIEGLKQVFGLSQQQQQQSMFMHGQAPSTMIGLPPSDAIKLEQVACSSSNPAISSVEAQIKWNQHVQEHAEKKNLHPGSMNNKLPSSLSDPVGNMVPRTMIVDGKPALMVHPQTVPPRPANPRNARSSMPRSMPPTPVSSESFFPMPYYGPEFDQPGFGANFEYMPAGPSGPPPPPPRCFVVQQTAGGRLPSIQMGHFGPPPRAMMMPPGGASMNVNMNIRVDGPPPQAPPDAMGMMPQGCYQDFVGGQLEENDPSYYDNGGLYPVPCGGNMQPPPNAFYCGPMMDDGSAMGRPPIRGNNNAIGAPPGGFVMDAYSVDNKSSGVHLAVGGGPQGGGPPPMVNNTFVNANLSIHQVNIQNMGGQFPSGNIVRVQSMQPTHQSVPYVVATQPPPPRTQQFPGRRQQHGPSFANNSPMPPSAMMMTHPPHASAIPVNFLHDFAEPLRNLDSKVPSQKLQYFPAMTPSSSVAQQQQKRAIFNETSASAPPQQSAESTTAAASIVGRSASTCGSRQDTNYEAQYENFQQQLYSISSCRSSESLSN